MGGGRVYKGWWVGSLKEMDCHLISLFVMQKKARNVQKVFTRKCSLSPSFFTIYIQNAKLDFIVVIKVMCIKVVR